MLFLDESGTPPSADAKNPNRYFVIAGVVIPEESWQGLRDALLGMKLRLKLRGEIKWRYFAPGNTDDSNPMRLMDSVQRDSVRAELFRILRHTPGLTVLACVASVEAAYELGAINNGDDLYEGTYKPVSERFQYHLQDCDKSAGGKHLGIIICDHRGVQDDARLKRHHEKLLYANSPVVSAYPNLVESLFLQSSNLSVGIQLADLVAGAVWRRFEKGDSRWFDQLRPTFRHRNGVIDGYGLVKFPKTTWR